MARLSARHCKRPYRSPAYIYIKLAPLAGGVVGSWLVHSILERAVRVRALAEDTVLCSWARHLTLTVPYSTQEYKSVPVNCWGNLTNRRGPGLNCDGLASHPEGVDLLLAASCYGNRDKLHRYEQFGSKASPYAPMAL